MLIELLISIICVIVVPIWWMQNVEPYNNELFKIISTDFSFSLKNSVSLAFIYYSGTMIITYAIYLLYPDKFDISKPQTFFPAIASAVCFCVIARLITWQHGYKYGKQFLSALIVSSSLIIIINFFIYINDTITALNLNIYNIIQVEKTLLKMQNYYIIQSLIIAKDFFIFTVLSSFSCAYIGEYVIRKHSVKRRSVTDDFENFGKFFEPLTLKDAENEMKKMLSRPNLKSIKLITNTLMIFELGLSSFNNADFKVIAPAPWNRPRLLNYEKLTILSKKLNQNLKQLEVDSEKVYQNRFDHLIELYSQNKLKWRDSNYEKLNVLIVNDEELLLRVYGSENKKYLYSNDPYAVQQFVHFFDGYFNSI